MRGILISTILLLSLTLGNAQGISFTDGKWADILAKAEQEDKLIFMDAYAVWCGPCKMMSANIFPQKEVGDFYNQHFINVKMDMEKGEGIALSEQYEVLGYPTFLFINSSGELVHRDMGAREATDFIDLGKAAIDPQRQYGHLKQQYEKGIKDPKLLYHFAVAAQQAGDPAAEVAAMEYLETQEDWSTEENSLFLLHFIPDDHQSPIFKYVVDHRAEYYQNYGKELIDLRLYNAVIEEAASLDQEEPAQVKELLLKALPVDAAERFAMKYDIEYAMYFERDAEKGRQAQMAYFDRYLDEVTDWNMLNAVAWDFYENVEDKKTLKKALKWALRSVELEENYYNTDTVAALYYKLGKKSKALESAKRAIQLAEEQGEDASGTEELLLRIKAM